MCVCVCVYIKCSFFKVALMYDININLLLHVWDEDSSAEGQLPPRNNSRMQQVINRDVRALSLQGQKITTETTHKISLYTSYKTPYS